MLLFSLIFIILDVEASVFTDVGVMPLNSGLLLVRALAVLIAISVGVDLVIGAVLFGFVAVRALVLLIGATSDMLLPSPELVLAGTLELLVADSCVLSLLLRPLVVVILGTEPGACAQMLVFCASCCVCTCNVLLESARFVVNK